MKKCEQILINRIVKEQLENLVNERPVYYTRLRFSKAHVYKSENYILLRSFNTFVAAIDEQGNCYDFLRIVYGYTATSAQHISKFYHDYGGKKMWTYKAV